MIKFEFESHENTPEDQYVKEIVTFKFTCIGKNDEIDIFYTPYFRKQTKEGRLFWDVSSLGVMKNGKKDFDDKFHFDSSHREKTIIKYLDNRQWENQKPVQPQGMQYPHGLVQNRSPMPEMPPISMDEVRSEAELPF